MPRCTDVLIADDDADMRARVRRALEGSPHVRVVAEADDGIAAWERLRATAPAIAIVDIGMPGLDGMALVRRIREHGLPVAVVLLTVCDEKPMFDAAFELGVKGYLLKHDTGDEILKCIEAVATGEHCASPPVVSHILDKARRLEQLLSHGPHHGRLTLQERAILRRIEQHKSSKEIAGELGISTRTVESHRLSICRKLGIRGNYGLNRFADSGDDV